MGCEVFIPFKPRAATLTVIEQANTTSNRRRSHEPRRPPPRAMPTSDDSVCESMWRLDHTANSCSETFTLKG
jgi:hypothetical protein